MTYYTVTGGRTRATPPQPLPTLLLFNIFPWGSWTPTRELAYRLDCSTQASNEARFLIAYPATMPFAQHHDQHDSYLAWVYYAQTEKSDGKA